jgi:hypothetical protein
MLQRSLSRPPALLGAIAPLCFAIALGCGAPPPPPVKIADAPPVQEKIDPGPTSVESDIGGLNEEAVESAFTSLGVQDCLDQASQRLREIGGAFKLKVRIKREGSVRWAYFSESTLGDRDTEKCLLDRVMAKAWPKPLGGEGIAEKAFEIDPQRKPVVLQEKYLRIEVDKARAATAKCRRGIRGMFLATIYVRPDGKVAAAGVAPPNEKGETVADCVVEAILKTRFRGASPRPAKISFEIR